MPIASHDFEQLMNQARVTLVGSSDAGLKGALYDVITEFLKDSSCWTQQIVFTAIPTSRVYPIEVDEGQIIRLAGVWTGTNADYPCNIPVPALMPDIGQLILAHAPNTSMQYVCEVVCNTALPTDRSAVPIAPDWLLPQWHVGLLDGLLGKMMLQPAKSYTNKETATYHLRRFRSAIAEARSKKLRANTNGAQAWRFPQSFRANTQQGGVPSTAGGTDRSF